MREERSDFLLYVTDHYYAYLVWGYDIEADVVLAQMLLNNAHAAQALETKVMTVMDGANEDIVPLDLEP